MFPTPIQKLENISRHLGTNVYIKRDDLTGLGLGGNLSIFDEAAHIDFIAKPQVGFYWNFNEEWAFGANAAYWFVPQMYSGSGKVTSSHSMFGNFMDVTLSVLFRF